MPRWLGWLASFRYQAEAGRNILAVFGIADPYRTFGHLAPAERLLFVGGNPEARAANSRHSCRGDNVITAAGTLAGFHPRIDAPAL